jgi:hypothetical protein
MTTNVVVGAKPSATPPPPVLPPLIPDTYGRYGKILLPGDESAHPVKLHMPGPGFGEVKVPRGDELAMREKLEALWKLSDEDIRAQLEQWPAFGKMTLRDEGAMLQRIQDFRDYRTRIAQQRAHDMGLSTLTPEQKARFETEYWDKRMQMDRELCKQFEPVYKAREQKLQDELFREFSTASPGPVPPKPPAPPAVNKPVVVSAPPPAPNSVVTAAPSMAPKVQ